MAVRTAGAVLSQVQQAAAELAKQGGDDGQFTGLDRADYIK
jgi:hypothetical protein